MTSLDAARQFNAIGKYFMRSVNNLIKLLNNSPSFQYSMNNYMRSVDNSIRSLSRFMRSVENSMRLLNNYMSSEVRLAGTSTQYATVLVGCDMTVTLVILEVPQRELASATLRVGRGIQHLLTSYEETWTNSILFFIK